MTNQVSTYLKYANLQMAAEALYDFLPQEDPATSQTFAGPIDLADLKLGNEHASKFTETLAADFIQQWEVVEHLSNTATGFSGTLFKGRQGGHYDGELVLSFRSTEFIDDAVRDNQATNKMEIAAHGWAFGQIADMEAWYASLQASGKLPTGATFTVTGYSLGGHLATAFNLLHQHEDRIAATYTFNGAGVGDVNAGESLRAVIDRFDRQRKNASGTEIAFSDPALQGFYESVRERLNVGERPSHADFAALENAPTASPSQKLLLRSEIGRAHV